MSIIKNRFFLKTLPIMVLASLFATQNIACGAPRAAIRGTAASTGRKPVANTSPTPVPVSATETATVEEEPEPEETSEPIVNKSSQFDSVLSSSTSASSSSDSAMAERIREQRAKIAAQEALDTINNALQNAKGGKNACDTGLRKCMSDDKVCGKDFTKCALDGDTAFGDKINKCKRDLTCTGEEVKLFMTEIKADRDMNVELKSYNAVIDCGNEYMKCIANECGMTFNKCLGKTAGDKAMNNCKSIATKCKEQDSGLPGRFGTVIGKLRETAEKDIKKDEERMYKLRDLMKGACEGLGAMFDERTFDCVYTVSFFAGQEQTNPMASRKRYAGDMFTCNQEWFGVDVTTYKENAYRETRAQTGASSAMLGAGVGTAAGLVTSGAIGRALDRQKAEKGLAQAKADQKAANQQSSTTEPEGEQLTIAHCKDKNVSLNDYGKEACKKLLAEEENTQKGEAKPAEEAPAQPEEKSDNANSSNDAVDKTSSD